MGVDGFVIRLQGKALPMSVVTSSVDRRVRSTSGRWVTWAAALTLPFMASGCIYRINIHQGNFLEAKTIDQLTVGMTRSQVRFLLGTSRVRGVLPTG